jgi:hypothetical protein
LPAGRELARLALQPQRLGGQAHVEHVVPGAGQVALEPEEDGGAGDAGRARFDAGTRGRDQTSCSKRVDLAIKQRAPAGGGDPVRGERGQIVGQLRLGQAAARTGDAHQHNGPQAIGVERAGCNRLLQHGGLHGRWASSHINERSCAPARARNG